MDKRQFYRQQNGDFDGDWGNKAWPQQYGGRGNQAWPQQYGGRGNQMWPQQYGSCC